MERARPRASPRLVWPVRSGGSRAALEIRRRWRRHNGALSTRPTEARPPGPRCECADIDAPVICKGGRIYDNACVAARFQATGCVPYGG